MDSWKGLKVRGGLRQIKYAPLGPRSPWSYSILVEAGKVHWPTRSTHPAVWLKSSLDLSSVHFSNKPNSMGIQRDGGKKPDEHVVIVWSGDSSCA